MMIRTNPPGAMVYIDEYPVGTTPIAVDFTYYGTRKIRLVKDGYETKTLLQSVPTPWYEYVPLDFISENLVPGQIRDHRTFEYPLEPQLVVPTGQLRERAEALRARTQTSGIVQTYPNPPPGLAPPPALPNAAPPGTPGPATEPMPPLPSPPSYDPGGWRPPQPGRSGGQ
ncbi:MAG: PEGA domain-containing protein [Thermoguttaceae bacterium]